MSDAAQSTESSSLPGFIRGPVEAVGGVISDVAEGIRHFGVLVLFFRETVTRLARPPYYPDVIMYQMYQVGVKSLLIAILAGSFVGGIFAIQINDQLIDFGAQAFLGGIAVSVTVREVGPLMIALLIAGRIGAFTAAELGTMNVTEQIDAIRCLGTDPIKYLVVPRFLACIVMSFVLTVVGIVIGILGSAVVAWAICGVHPLFFFGRVLDMVHVFDFVNGLWKSFFFGILIATVCCYYGFNTRGGAEDVGRNVNTTVVVTGISLLAADYFLALISSWFYTLILKVGEI